MHYALCVMHYVFVKALMIIFKEYPVHVARSAFALTIISYYSFLDTYNGNTYIKKEVRLASFDLRDAHARCIDNFMYFFILLHLCRLLFLLVSAKVRRIKIAPLC